MPSPTVIKVFCRELFARQTSTRQPEPDLVMDAPENVEAYLFAGREDGSLQPVYLFQCAQICEVIKPGDTVLDLGCGPATQLAMVARLNPDIHFIGVDLSEEMLEKATAYVQKRNLSNIEFKLADITNLSCFENESMDAVISTLVLHHLPDIEMLDLTFAEVKRVLKPEGGLYLADLGHLKSEQSIRDFADQYSDRQPELFTLDYLNSLRAAFYSSDFLSLHQKHLATVGKFYTTFMMPYMMAIKSRARRGDDAEKIIQKLQNIKLSMAANHRTDLQDLRLFFRLGGLKTPYLR